MDAPVDLELGTNNAPPYLHWLVVCAACGLPTLGRGLVPCSAIERFRTNEVVKCTHCNDIRQYLAAQFFLGPFPRSEPGTRYRYGPTLVIAAAIIAAVRLAREDLSTRSPRIVAGIGNSVQLAKEILDTVRQKVARSVTVRRRLATGALSRRSALVLSVRPTREGKYISVILPGRIVLLG